MNRKNALFISISLLAAVGLSGCAGMKPHAESVECDEGSPKKDVTIKYGDSNLSADAKKNVKRDEYLVFKLSPDSSRGPNNLDYKTVKVTVKGKDAASKWIAASGTDNDSDGELVVCVPNDVATNKTYFYEITVDDVGTLDPRVIVEP